MKRLPIVYASDLSGRDYWRSLGERAGDPALRASLAAEFPPGASQLVGGEGTRGDAGAPSVSPVSRRGFLSIMGAAVALATGAGCRRPEEKILPYTRPPEEVVPGNPLYFATALPIFGTAIGLLVESHEGRPTKIEGNPRHPESLGATGLYPQATVLDLYDPDRSTSPHEKGQPRTWDDASAFLSSLGERSRGRKGKGLAILTEAHRSPTLAAALDDLKRAMPEARVVRYEAFSRANVREGAKLAFGEPLETVRDVGKAKVIVALESDFLANEGSPIKQARGWAEGRNPNRGGMMNRLYAVESMFSVTGACADHRVRMMHREVVSFAFALAGALARAKVDVPEVVAAAAHRARGVLSPQAERLLAAIVADLASNRGASLLVAGDTLPPAVHAVVHILNAALGNVGKTVRHVAPFDATSESPAALVSLSKAMTSKEVDTVVILGGNPVFDAPADADFARALAGVTSVHVSTHVDETSAASSWHVNRAHYLEAWGDVRGEDGTAAIAQPLIAPLYDGKTDSEVVRLLLGESKKSHELVRATWQATLAAPAVGAEAGATFEKAWRRALHEGVVPGSAFETVTPTGRPLDVAAAMKAIPPAADGLEITFRPDVHAWDGRFANNGWLQEFPDPMTKVTWGNAAAMSEKTGRALGVAEGDVVSITIEGRAVRLPVVFAPGQADGSIALTIGQGRTRAGRVGDAVGVNVYPVRTSTAFYAAQGAKVEALKGDKARIARTQEHFLTEGRPLVREGTLKDYERDPAFAEKMVEHPPLESLWEPHRYDGHKWGMAIDLNACIGCGACMVACQAENNTPIVGVEGVTMSREMHWIRVDRYYEGPAEDPRAVSQPMTCQQCENAPCEQVCPVGATTHSPEGLNDMAYNRCIGTRYCANNCPFKVRRFNFFDYAKSIPDTRKMQLNPDVTVRSRGVMEKCTFCVQRVNGAKIDAKRHGHDRVKDGSIVSACQQSCPTQEIHFGDLGDPTSKVAQKSAAPLAYHLLEELNVRPRVSYLARLRNPSPELEPA